jgi:hypothetical protein
MITAIILIGILCLIILYQKIIKNWLENLDKSQLLTEEEMQKKGIKVHDPVRADWEDRYDAVLKSGHKINCSKEEWVNARVEYCQED